MACEGPLCVTCPQQTVGQRRILPDGQGTNGILIVGESPWRDEVRLGRPFAGAAGAQLDKWFRRLGVSRDAFTITNSLWCAPPYLGWFNTREAADAINHCRPYLDDLIERVRPKVIVTLGGTALQRITGLGGELNKLHSYVLDSPYNIPVIGTYHPNYIMQGQHKLTGACIFALRRALEIAKVGSFNRQPVTYHLDPLLEEAEAYFNGWLPDMPMANDIETPMSGKIDEDNLEKEDSSFTIIRASFSWKVGTGISFPWCEPFISLAKRILKRAKHLIYWNRNYDVPRLIANGCEITAQIIDGMWAWHWLQSDMLKSLGFVSPFYTDLPAWKHLSDTEPALYSCIDSDATLRNYEGTRKDIEAQGRWPMFMRHCVETTPILQGMGQRGILCDREQQASLKKWLEASRAEANEVLQPLIPLDVKPLKIYKRQPKVDPETWTLKTITCSCVIKKREVCKKCKGQRELVGWMRPLPFNPESADQILALIRYMKLPVPIDRKTKKPSTAEKHLARFAKKHEVFKWIVECSKRSTMISTFIWELPPDSRVRTTYGFHPSTWRKSSRATNLMNIPNSKRAADKLSKEIAERLRRALVAAPGHLLIEADSAAIEAVLVGYAAGDLSYIRLAKAGVHDYLTAHLVGKPVDKDLPLDVLVPRLQEVKREFKVQREQAKRCIHGGNYMLSAYGMHDEYPEFFPCEKDAQELIDFYFGLFPSITQWHRSTLERAAKENYLENHFQYRHWFFNVFSRKDGEVTLGTDAKRAIAFVPQSDASAIQTEFLLELARDERVAPHLRLIIHDSIVLEVPERDVGLVASLVHQTMTKPLAQLGGLFIGAEVSVGPSLGEMETLELGENKVTKTLDIPPLCDSLQLEAAFKGVL